MKWHEMKRGSKLMMTWVTIVPENEVSDAPEIFYPLPLGKTSTEKNVFFWALPESPKPPDPNSGNLVLFFYVKNNILRV